MSDPLNSPKIKIMADNCLLGRMRLVSRRINSIYDTALRPYGLKASQMYLLVVISHFGETTSKELSTVLQMDTSTFSRALTILQNKQWIVSEPSGNGKILNIRATKQGLNKIEMVFPDWEKAQIEATELLGESGVNAILKAAAKHLTGG